MTGDPWARFWLEAAQRQRANLLRIFEKKMCEDILWKNTPQKEKVKNISGTLYILHETRTADDHIQTDTTPTTTAAIDFTKLVLRMTFLKKRYL